MVTTTETPAQETNPSGLSIEERLAALAGRKEEVRHALRSCPDSEFDRLNLEYGQISAAYASLLREFNETRITEVRLELFDAIQEMVEASSLAELLQEPILQIVYQVFPAYTETKEDGTKVEHPAARELAVNAGYILAPKRTARTPATATPAAKPAGAGNTGGWSHPQYGSNLSLGAAFDKVATAEEHAQHDAATTNSKQWQIKTKVVKAAGFTKPEA